MEVNLEEAKIKLGKYGQEQVLKFYDELSDEGKDAPANMDKITGKTGEGTKVPK